ncbi:centromere protein O [Eublepharis macularius]|uniref:Centromere protein O n=1 Tax=Eublepharis macularius TaxID=481883 RepID=A0AA97KZL9_EUBMA|nr:centromere protein O [Eublepharis macularius]XP_054836893.1 centromere protein O [Eublepharis macularius]
MEASRTSLRDGVLSHLENLEACSHQLALKQEEEEQQEENVARLKARIQELKHQRDKMKAKLNLIRGKDGTQSATQTPQASNQAALELRVQNLKNLLKMFRLTGISGKLTREGVCLCIGTAFEGTYLDSYYLHLRIQHPIQIQRHTVPAFIHLKQIADEYLQTDVKRFFSVLSDHLNAYAGRKFQAEQLQEHFAALLAGPLQANSLYSLVEFSYRVEAGGKTFPFLARLTYEDPTCILPTEASVAWKEDAVASGAEMVASHKALFCEKPLHKVFRSFTDSTENLSQAVAPEPSTSTAGVPLHCGKAAAW